MRGLPPWVGVGAFSTSAAVGWDGRSPASFYSIGRQPLRGGLPGVQFRFLERGAVIQVCRLPASSRWMSSSDRFLVSGTINRTQTSWRIIMKQKKRNTVPG